MRNRYCDDIRYKVSPLHHVMARCSTAEVLDVLNHKYCNVNCLDSANQTPIYYAIFRGYRTGVNLLLQRGARLNVQDKDGNSPLHFAVKWGYTEIVHELLKNNADMEAKNKYGQTVLHYAIVWNYRKSFEAIVDLLLRNGADVNARDKDEETPLHCAAARRDSSFVCKMLLLKGASLSEREKKAGNSPLHISTLRLCKETITTLLNNGANLEQKNCEGETPLHCAVKSTILEAVEFLLGKGADVNAVNKYGESSLHIASSLQVTSTERKEDIIKVLLANGADINQEDNEGNTALHAAAATYRGECVDLLIENGANVKARNSYGETPSYMAIMESYEKKNIINLLNWETSLLGNNFEFYSMLNINSEHECSYHQLSNHIVKLKSAKLNINNELYAPLHKIPSWSCAESICDDEAKKMKAKLLGRNSLYEVFSNFADPLFLSNKELENYVNSDSLDRDFPIYASLLKVTMKKCKKRLSLLNNALTGLQELWPSNDVRLPSEVWRKILSYLDEDDLRSVTLACKNEDPVEK